MSPDVSNITRISDRKPQKLEHNKTDQTTRGNGNVHDSGENNGEISISFWQSLKVILLTGPLNALLVTIPLAILSSSLNLSHLIIFILSLLALAPLAERLGYVTEQLAFHTNDTVGGLLNATFGNATEIIVAISALYRGLYRLVQLSLLGSILSNLLLVLGTALLCGGLRHEIQYFQTLSGQINSTLLMLSTMTVLFPTILIESGGASRHAELGLSRATSLLLFILYGGFLYFQLYSHKHLYEDIENSPSTKQHNMSLQEEEEKKEDRVEKIWDLEDQQHGSTMIEMEDYDEGNEIEIVFGGIEPPMIENDDEQSTIHSSCLESDEDRGFEESSVEEEEEDDEEGVGRYRKRNRDMAEDDEEEEEEDELGFYNALFWLAVITLLIAILSDALAATIEKAAESMHISGVFISAIVLPIVGNAAEHAGAVMFAWKGKVDLALGVAIGSSTQVALCVLPLLVILGWFSDHDLDLNLGAFECSSLFISVVSTTFAIKDGSSNWLVGTALLVAYLIIAVAFWAHHEEDLGS
eukprot:gene7418-8202_t